MASTDHKTRINAYLAQLRHMQALADRIRQMRLERMRKLSVQAGLGDLQLCVLHNALVGRETGKPWPGINYSLARKLRWLEETSHEPSRIVDRWYQRTYWPRAMGLTGPCGKPVDDAS